MGQPLDPRVEIGHVRLRTRDLDRSLDFYRGALGFEVTERRGASAAFLGAGGFRHHIELPSAGANGSPYRFAIRYPDRVALANALVRLEQLYPLDEDQLKAAVGQFPNLKTIIWCQEESQNIGAWSFIESRLRSLAGREILYAGRNASARRIRARDSRIGVATTTVEA